MRLYEGTIANFIDETTHNRIVDELKGQFENYYGRKVNDSEVGAWTNSLQFLKNVVEVSSPKENMISIEYELPYSNERIDCLLFGEGIDGKKNVNIVELKQWSKVTDCEIDENVMTFVGGANRMVPHPSVQVRGYHYYLEDFLEVFHESTILSSCVYCHNYSHNNPVLFQSKFETVLKEFPIFTKEDFEKFSTYLKVKLEKGNGMEIFGSFCSSKIKPSKRLVDMAKHMIEGQRVFNLIDDQITANNTIIDRAKKCSKLDRKSVIIVKGGPGTGKSVIALNAVAELLKQGRRVFHATGSAAFTTTLRKIVGTRVANLFKYFNSFTHHNENEIDVLICDEAHRIRTTSNSRYTKTQNRTNIPQIEELIQAAKVSIFFIDEFQVVRPGETGSTPLIKEYALKFNADLYEFELKTQFRCSGSDGYLNWIDNTLSVRETANIQLTKEEKMEFRIFDSPLALHAEIVEKNKIKPNSARLVAGYCWPWSDANHDGTLKKDVVIGDFQMTWEAKNEATNLKPGIPKAALWAYDPNGVDQVGSIYTIQGFEFDYVGVIFAKDLCYDPVKKEWIAKPENSCDKVVKRARQEEFLKFFKNTYRVLMTRGMKGCYVYFMDKNTEEFFKSRIRV